MLGFYLIVSATALYINLLICPLAKKQLYQCLFFKFKIYFRKQICSSIGKSIINSRIIPHINMQRENFLILHYSFLKFVNSYLLLFQIYFVVYNAKYNLNVFVNKIDYRYLYRYRYRLQGTLGLFQALCSGIHQVGLKGSH